MPGVIVALTMRPGSPCPSSALQQLAAAAGIACHPVVALGSTLGVGHSPAEGRSYLAEDRSWRRVSKVCCSIAQV